MARNKKRPEENPSKTQVPDIRRDDNDLLKRGRTEKGEAKNISNTNKETANPGRADRGEQEGPVDDHVIRP